MVEFLKSKKGRIILISAALIIIIAVILLIVLLSNNTKGYRSISVSELLGQVMAENNGSEYAAYQDMKLYDGYALTTSDDSYSRLVLDYDKYIKLEENSRAIFESLGASDSGMTTIALERGSMTNELTKPLAHDEEYVVNTPNAVLAVRGTFFRADVKQDANGDAYTDVYVYGGTVVCHRIMPDGSHVEEEVEIPAGYKACIKMDEIITIYVEELIDEDTDNVDPIDRSEISDDDIVNMYVSSYSGHDMYISTEELWDEITERKININDHRSPHDGKKIPHYDEHRKDPDDDKDDREHGRPNSDDSKSDHDDEHRPPASNTMPTEKPEEEVTTQNSSTPDDTTLDSSATTSRPVHTTRPATTTTGRKPAPGGHRPSSTTITVPATTASVLPEEPEVDVTTVASTPETTPEETTAASTVTTATTVVTPEVTSSTTPYTTTSKYYPPSKPSRTTTSAPTTTAPITTTPITTTPVTTTPVTTTPVTTTPVTTTPVTTTPVTTTPVTTIPDTTTNPGDIDDDPDEPTIDGLAIDDVNFPDSALRSYISTNFDIDQNGHLTDEEISSITSIDVSGTAETDGGIASLQGIEHFTQLATLKCSYNAALSTLDTTCNLALSALYCGDTGLSVLDVSKNSALTILECSNTSIGYLDLSNNPVLTAIDIQNTALSSIDTSQNGYLENLVCNNTTISELILSQNYALEYLSCNSTKITALDLSSNENLQTLCCSDNSISSLNVSANTALQTLECNNCKLAFLDVSDNAALTAFTAEGNEYVIPSNATVYVLSQISGFDAANASNWTNCYYDPAANRLVNITGDASYTYNCGQGNSANFKLVRTGEEVDIPFDGILYTDNGNIVITETGVLQGDATEEIAWTGDYVITQLDSNVLTATISVQSGSHNLTLDGINISADSDMFTINSGAEVALNGTSANTLSATTDGISGIYNSGTLKIESGEFTLTADNFGIYNAGTLTLNGATVSAQGDSAGVDNEGTLTVNSGTLNATGIGSVIWGYGIYNNGTYSQTGGSLNVQGGAVEDFNNNSSAVVTGGSLRLANSSQVGDLTNADGDVLEVCVFDTLPSATDITEWNGIEYTYSIAETDAANDGSFYIWVPKFDGTVYMDDGSVTITETGITQGDMSAEYAFVGDYVLSQKNSTTTIDDICVTFESGTHNVTMNNTYIRGESSKSVLYISDDAIVDLSGNNNALYSTATYISGLDISGTLKISNGTFTFDGITITGSAIVDNANIEFGNSIKVQSNGDLTVNSGTISVIGTNIASALANWGTVTINGGSTILSGNQYGISNSGGLSLTNGSTIISGGEADINTSNAVNVTGGSLRVVNDTINGSLTNGTDELECVIYDTFPDEATRTFAKSDGTTYIYNLTEADCTDDGKYYVWKPISLGVEINDTNFPDEIFRTYVSTNFDTDTNGYLSDEEISNITSVNCSSTIIGSGLTSLKGIEYFTEMTLLDCQYQSQLTELDVSNAIALKYLYCSLSGITELDISNNPELLNLQFYSTDVAEIDLSHNTKLERIYCHSTNLTSLDIKNNPNLTHISCYSTGISELDVSNNTALVYLDCNSLNIPTLDLSANAALTDLNCYNTDITELDLSNNTLLENLDCSNTGLTKLDVSYNTALKDLDCRNLSIITLDLSANVALTDLNCYNTDITDLDLSNNTALECLECYSTNITELDVSNNASLTALYCHYTNITELDVSNNMALEYLACYGTDISSLDLRNNTALSSLLCYDSVLAYIDVTQNTNLTNLKANGNAFPIPCNATTFDTSTITGFDPTKVSDVTNADFDVATGVFSNITGDITYTYDCGNSFSEIFTLTRTGEAVFDGTLYTEDGDIAITETGVTQGDATEETAWTGDYTITQRNSATAVNCAINIYSGIHNITMSGVNILADVSGIYIASSATVTLIGGSDSNTITETNTNDTFYPTIDNRGILTITGGNFSLADDSTCINQYGTLDINSDITMNALIFVAGETRMLGGTVFTPRITVGSGDHIMFELVDGSLTINTSGTTESSAIWIGDTSIFSVSGGKLHAYAADVENKISSAIYAPGTDCLFKVSGGTVTLDGYGADLYLINENTANIIGGSVKLANNTISDGDTVTNSAGTAVYFAAIPCTDPSTVTIYNSLDILYSEYDVNAVHDDGYAYIWLPVGTYYIKSNGINYTVSVTETGSTVTQS